MRLTSRRNDDADLIRARLRALLDEGRRPPGWVPDGPVTVDPLLRHGSAVDDEDDDEDGAELPGGIGRHRAPGAAVRLDPGRRGAWSLWAVGLLAALLVALVTWWSRPQVEAVPEPAPGTSAATPSASTPAASPSVGEVADASATVVVSVVGLVARPGLVTLPEGARVADALAAAGGLLPDADPASVNLAAVVADGQQIAVGVPGATPGTGASAEPAGTGLVDLNRATTADLDALPGIGPVLAQRIVDHRDRQGPFRSVEQLDDVPGIGPAIFAELAELVTV